MSRRPLPHIDEKILAATIEVAGPSLEANRFSTSEIAKKALCSEYVIYSHFKSKEKLIAATSAFLLHHISLSISEEIARSKGLVDLFLKMLVEAERHPAVTGFILNYSHIFPRAKAPADYEGYRDNMKLLANDFAKAYPLKKELDSDLSRFLTLTHLFRELVCSAKSLILKEVPSSDEVRLLMAKNAIAGLACFK